MFQDDAYEEQHSIRSLKNPEERPPKLNGDRQILLIMRRLLLLYYDVSLRKSLHVNTGSFGEKER